MLIKYAEQNPDLLLSKIADEKPSEETSLQDQFSDKTTTIPLPPEFSLLDDPGVLTEEFSYNALRDAILKELGKQQAEKLSLEDGPLDGTNKG